MIATWMVLATLIAALLGIAALAATRVLSAWRRPSRGVWSAALALSIALPVIASIVGPRMQASTARARVPDAIAAGPTVLPAFVVRAGSVVQARAVSLAALDRPLALLWLAGSTLVLLLLARGVRDLARARRDWRPTNVDGVPVLLADDTGPAVVGVRHPAIVLPAWALELDAPLRALVLRHEAEHRAAHDQLHLALGALVVALMPWNVAVWWQLRRLRIAVEIDCDARVLAAHHDVSRYGLLLLAVAQRRATSTWRLAGAPALAESSSDLAQRITAMRTPFTHRRALRTLTGLTIFAIAVAGAFVACSTARDVTSPKGVVPVDGHLATLLTSDSSLIMVGGRTYQLVSGTPTMPKSGELVSTGARQLRDTSHVRLLPGMNASTPDSTNWAAKGKLPMKPMKASEPYFEFQVEKPVLPIPGNIGPRYPEEMKTAQVEGMVMAQFVVDTLGHVVPGSFKVLKSDHELFTQAVASALPNFKFTPALVGNRKVKQLVQEPFMFQLAK